MSGLRIHRRTSDGREASWPVSLPPLLRRLYAARGVEDPQQVVHRLSGLPPPQGLSGLAVACDLLAEAIDNQQAILVVGDYDCDGATGCAVAVRGLQMLGAKQVEYAVPDRKLHGYGLSPALLDSLDTPADLIVTVDNGINAHAGVDAAHARGMRVLITDHHLPGSELPAADAIVNPNVPGERFPGKALAGVGVMFYVLLALRKQLGSDVDLRVLLDLVALGTVADMVPLDDINRILVESGLRRIRAGRASPGVAALSEMSGRNPATLVSSDFGFALAPRLNAAGRLENMRCGVECLLSDDPEQALHLARQLHEINHARRQLQDEMLTEAEACVADLDVQAADGVVVFQSHWHPGVVGLVASRLKEQLHRPVVALAPNGDDGLLRGSARSIPGVHVRDVLVDVASRAPGMMAGFGGHAMAAGLTLAESDLDRFAGLFNEAVGQRLDDSLRDAVLWTDGELAADDVTLENAALLRFAGPWGQGFPAPLFDNLLVCVEQRTMGRDGNHRRLMLCDPRNQACHPGVMFAVEDDLPMHEPLRVVYELAVNDWNGHERLQLIVRHVEQLTRNSG